MPAGSGRDSVEARPRKDNAEAGPGKVSVKERFGRNSMDRTIWMTIS